MLGRIAKQSKAIRDAALLIDDCAHRADRLPDDTADAAELAGLAVPGFMYADAAKALAEDLDTDMRELRVHWTDTANVLVDFADHWDLADAATAHDFQRAAYELGCGDDPDEQERE